MANGKFVAYYRVSTDKQGQSGLGLEAQRAAVTQYLNGGSWSLLAEFTEVESGKHSDRPELAKALAYCKRHKATLVIAKLDRLSRNLAFIANMMDSKTDFVACDNPHANRLTLHILAAVAEDEAARISARTVAALQAAKERGQKLGWANPARTDVAQASEAGREAQREAADAFAAKVLPLVEKLRDGGVKSMADVAKELNDKGVKTARGGQWYASTVANVLARK